MLNSHLVPAARARRAAGLFTAIAALTGGVATSPRAQGVRINLKAWREPVLLDTLRQDHSLKAAADKVYQAALQVYSDLGIPTGQTDGKAGIIGSERFERARNLAS